MNFKFGKPSFSSNRPDARRFKGFPTKILTVGEKPNSVKRDTPVKRLTDAEWQLRRDEGLCFKCDEKFVVGHQC